MSGAPASRRRTYDNGSEARALHTLLSQWRHAVVTGGERAS